ncbi:MAG: hypothetical protein J6W50_00490, partial [Bacteroidaceae bacterium]|nr:hypothetical protein [Bacteroidaceae bacterium]
MKKKTLSLIFLSLLLAAPCMGQQAFKVNLWSEGETTEPDYSEAVLHCFLPDKPTGKAVIA